MSEAGITLETVNVHVADRVATVELSRRLGRLGEHFERRGLRRPWQRIANDLWTAWLFADLVPEELRGLAT